MNTVSTNFANLATARGTEAPSTIWGKLNKEVDRDHTFDHPFVQAVCMFMGEFLCLVAHMITKKRRTPTPGEIAAEESGVAAPVSSNCRAVDNGTFWFLLPACCDMCGTGTMYAGLCLSYASVFQMLRGSVVVFTAFLSCIFLKRTIFMYQWFAVFLVVVGVFIVGVTSLGDSGGGGKDPTGVAIGNMLIILAQVIVAVQMCIEEKIMSVYQTPALKVVGLEGTYGFCILGTLLIPMYYIRIEGVPFENAPDAFAQASENWVIVLAMLGNVLSIAFFNFFGISITKNMSASHRMVLDSVRTLLVWAISLSLGWEKFHAMQLLGFAVLSCGIAVYNEVITLRKFFKYPEAAEEQRPFVGDADHGTFISQAASFTQGSVASQTGLLERRGSGRSFQPGDKSSPQKPMRQAISESGPSAP